MALDDLQGVIEKLGKMIETHGGYLSGHETRTRQVLIDPLLRELGWDVSDPAAVQLEYKVGKQWADYALMSDDQPVAVIEAKPLGSDLEDDEMMQVLNYANRDGIEYMIVTDGDKWEMYEVFQRGALEERLSMKLGLSQQSSHKNALQALAMWKSNLASDGGPSEATEPVLVSPESALDRSSSLPDEPPEQQLPNNSSQDFEEHYTLISEQRFPRHATPIRLEIGANIEKDVNNWLDVIHEVVTWLVDERILRKDDCPISAEKYTFIGREAINPDGTAFIRPQPLPNGLVLQRSLTTVDQWQRLRKLIQQFEEQRKVNPSQIRVFYKPTGQTRR